MNGFNFILVTSDGQDMAQGTLHDLKRWLTTSTEADKLPDLDSSWEGDEDAPVLHMHFNESEVYQMDVEETRSFLAQLVSVL